MQFKMDEETHNIALTPLVVARTLVCVFKLYIDTQQFRRSILYSNYLFGEVRMLNVKTIYLCLFENALFQRDLSPFKIRSSSKEKNILLFICKQDCIWPLWIFAFKWKFSSDCWFLKSVILLKVTPHNTQNLRNFV